MMVCGLPLSTCESENLLKFEEDKAMSCGNLSSTLQKLYAWEQKLLHEVEVILRTCGCLHEAAAC